MKKRIYISGKIGIHVTDETRQKFNCAAQRIKAAGCEPVNPFNNGLSEGARWIDHMMADLDMLKQCHGIYMLPDWEQSDGARIEHWYAQNNFAMENIVYSCPQCDQNQAYATEK